MPRAKRGVKLRRRHNKIMKAAKGYVGGKGRLFRQALATVRRGWRYGTRDRHVRKGIFRRLWITRINAGAKDCGVSYSKLINWLDKSGVEIDRKVLSDIAVFDMPTFRRLVDSVRPQA